MSVAAHLGIRLEDYDRRVRTFIPGYEALLDSTAAVVAAAARGLRAPQLVDLGVGTGALAARCLDAVPGAVLLGIDSDPAILQLAARRLGRRRSPVTLVRADLTDFPFPPCDAVVATLALHHVRTLTGKQAFYERCFDALRAGGIVASGDRHPSSVAALAAGEAKAWLAHLRESYSPAAARNFLEAWAAEDFYTTLEQELELIRAANFSADVAWRQRGFAVVVGAKRRGGKQPS